MSRCIYKLPLRLRSLFRKSRVERELSDELRFHLEKLTEENVGKGMAPDEARYAALRELGGVEQIKEECRDTRGTQFVEALIQDIHYGLRQLRRNPGFTAVAVITLALGIGANTAVFSVVSAALIEPLAFPRSKELVRLWDDYGHKGNAAPVSYPNFADWRAWNHSFSGMAAITGADYTLTGNGEPEHLLGITASANLFQVFGVQPVLGRRFRPDEDLPHADNGADAIILSYKLWRTRFSGDPKVLGKVVKLDDEPFMIVGVAPRGIESRMGSPHAEFWTTVAPLAERSSNSPKPASEERGWSFLMTVARLKPGVTLAQAQADMDHVAKDLMGAYPKDDPDEGVLIKGFQRSMTTDAQPILLLLLCAVGVVLLIACADVGGMLLARAAGRRREIAIRAALGAGRPRIVRQLLVESLLLALIAGGFGLWIGLAVRGWLDRYLGLTGIAQARPGAWVLGFTFMITTLAAIIFGIAPALHAAKRDLVRNLKEGGPSASGSREQQRMRSVLVTLQIALAAVLLTSAGLLTRSLVRLERTNSGFDPQHVLTFPVTLPAQQYPQATWAPFFEKLVTRLRALPGVVSASAGFELPFQGGVSRTAIVGVAGHKIPLSQRRGIVFSPITPGYFRTLGIPILKGRAFTDDDTATSVPAVVINETAARRYFGKRDPIGQQIEPGMWDGSGAKTEMRTIVGVAGDVKLQSLREAAEPMIYWPVAQIPCDSSMHVDIRTSGNPLGIVRAARVQLHSMDNGLPFYSVWSLDHYVSESLTQTRYNVWLVALFAILSLILTATGLYGAIAYSVAQRTHEVGIRMALGAHKSDVLRLVVGQGMILALIGVGIGIVAALGLTRLLASLLYGVKPTDPLTFIVVSLILIAVALLACYIPARRAAKVDPMVALRYE